MRNIHKFKSKFYNLITETILKLSNFTYMAVHFHDLFNAGWLY